MLKRREYRFETFRRDAAGGRRVIYVRFIAEDGLVVTTRSTGREDDKSASGEIMRLSRELDLDGLEHAKRMKLEAGGKPKGKLEDMSFADFLAWFWSPEGDYVKDMVAAGDKTSSSYLGDNQGNIRRYIAPYAPFQEIPLRRMTFHTIDTFFREARSFPRVRPTKGEPMLASRAMLTHWVGTLRTATNWASARGMCPRIDYKGIKLPKGVERERGLLDDKEIAAILALPTQQLWREESGAKKLRSDVMPRPRLKDGKKNDAASTPIDIRMKAFVLLGPFCGFRRGEERGLRWQAVDLEEGLIRVENNYVDVDGDKDPKRGSFGVLPIAPELEVVLWELKEFAKALGMDNPEDYILYNPPDRTKPAGTSALRRGWERIMLQIGISPEERKARNLVPHGTRHRFATKLMEAGLTPQEAQKLTRHKTLEMLERYSNHVSAETFEKAREAVRGRGKPPG